VHIDLSIGRRSVFQQHVDELANRARRLGGNELESPSLTLAVMLEALAEPGTYELAVKLDAEQEAALLAAIDEWMLDAQKLPDDILALRQALRRLGV
jgi:hypothetical protein